MTQQVAIIGAGAAGLAAAYDLSRAGAAVTIYEAGPEVGGLAAGFRDEGWEWTLEKFYHHWFANDDAVLGLVKELGVGDKLLFPRPITSLWLDGKIYQMDRPNIVTANLRLPISLLAKVRYGLTGLYLRFFDRWQPMERVTADQWLRRTMGREAYERVWRSLLIGKFGRVYDQVNMAWFWARVYKRTPRLGTFAGGFQAFLELLAARDRELGVKICLNTPVERIEQRPEGGLTVTVAGEPHSFDAVISTSSPHIMQRLAPGLPAAYQDKLGALKSMGAVVVVLALKHQLLTDGTYWLSLPSDNPDKSKSEFPFLALVEHTNYMDRAHYGGDHIVYCGDYVEPDHEYFSMSDEALVEHFTGALKTFNPAFSPDWIRKSWVFRVKYAQPIPFVNHSQAIPDLRTPIPGLYFASMSQVYPWDRGTNYAVEMGRNVASMLLQDQGMSQSGA
ncbi:MAG TPA: NAD(P)/FAD-dependent oxidoreductase [Aggregatilinea sp.]|uniref:NAD(P)/FAD-dependent oxidoreductase n=1 Tax=Aggregatilinea sp. TaxID=2806333 RepID=UPI002C082E89|nr:NAD(P)/FAD-dependent oxidoreductase [Aggregatilinea sp.]HML20030.1 NAD(P)/FAD-dependent oxidoreductase [Aggregatilinea sp.]